MTPEVSGVLMALGAGLCTTIGGACVFFITTFHRLPLAVTMGMSAGVMAYVSFVEIFSESKNNMRRGLESQWGSSNPNVIRGYSYLFSTLCFFGGWFLASLMDIGLELLVRTFRFDRAHMVQQPSTTLLRRTDDSVVGIELSASTTDRHPEYEDEDCKARAHEICTASAEKTALSKRCYVSKGETVEKDSGDDDDGKSVKKRPRKCLPLNWFSCHSRLPRSESEAWEIAHAEECFRRDTKKFLQMGVFTALALSLHNIPEGVATFIGSLSSPELGASVAVAIGIHNIPEGFAVSVPLYFGTGRKWHAFFYSFVTGFAEPIGALIAWAILGNDANPLALGIAFGVVCGIMTNIALKELLPAAFKYDPCNEVTTKSFVGGMLIMAFSLCLFQFQ